ncbi:hypothetical protein BGHDH14_bghG005404000002001 [Blumeria hordei DH14]|uniref:DUF676 domain-containing protein n=1 Tax=Blumeria graminis f. sp. hordei (strain DH14) TaxID=546991 RepID=N1JHN6_BLUG1|nr:hypothetical protein BGHDH14_bghG005404000002001 [Blumeria hordei DH14]
MNRILLLCFIHGFKGGSDTFGAFPEHLRALVNHGIPHVDVRVIIYPKYETRGQLDECVCFSILGNNLSLAYSGKISIVLTWRRLRQKVIDIDVEIRLRSASTEPSIQVVLVGHSMGGIVAADAVRTLYLVSKFPTSSSSQDNSVVFPKIQGVLTFDTPFLGISPGVLTNISPNSSVLTQIGRITKPFWGFKDAMQDETYGKSSYASTSKDNSSSSLPTDIPTPMSTLQGWSKATTLAGTVAALATVTTAAYWHWDSVLKGWSWIDSHLEFVKCLLDEDSLRGRLADMEILNHKLNMEFGNFYTRLGKNAANSDSGALPTDKRSKTFCKLSEDPDVLHWQEAVNTEAKNEIQAHTGIIESPVQ